MFLIILGGFLMALADSVPGVSGGTIAFLMGFYDDFINSLNNIASRDKEKRINNEDKDNGMLILLATG